MDSSVIEHISYNAVAKSLKITFVTGMVYQYHQVPKRVFDRLINANSKGKYFNSHIKDHYAFKKLDNA